MLRLELKSSLPQLNDSNLKLKIGTCKTGIEIGRDTAWSMKYEKISNRNVEINYKD